MIKSKYDSFNAFMVRGAAFAGDWEIPAIESVPNCIPKDLVLFTEISKPIGVSEYRVTGVLPEELRDKLPSVEDIQNRIGLGIDSQSIFDLELLLLPKPIHISGWFV